jgi:hypothetical protein
MLVKKKTRECTSPDRFQEMEPRARVELATCRLRIGCSTTELPRQTCVICYLQAVKTVVPILVPMFWCLFFGA